MAQALKVRCLLMSLSAADVDIISGWLWADGNWKLTSLIQALAESRHAINQCAKGSHALNFTGRE